MTAGRSYVFANLWTSSKEDEGEEGRWVAERERERAGVNSFREQLVVQTGPTVVCRTDVQPLLAVSV